MVLFIFLLLRYWKLNGNPINSGLVGIKDQKILVDKNKQPVEFGIEKWFGDTDFSTVRLKGLITDKKTDPEGNLIVTLSVSDDSKANINLDFGRRDDELFVEFPKDNNIDLDKNWRRHLVMEIEEDLRVGTWIVAEVMSWRNSNMDCQKDLVGEKLCERYKEQYLSHKVGDSQIANIPSTEIIKEQELLVGPVIQVIIPK